MTSVACGSDPDEADGSAGTGGSSGAEATGGSTSGGVPATGGSPSSGGVDDGGPGGAGCEHTLTSHPPKDESELRVGTFCDTVSVCFGSAAAANAVAAADEEASCGEQATQDCPAERVCSWHGVHGITEAQLAAFCAYFDAAASVEQVSCFVFL